MKAFIVFSLVLFYIEETSSFPDDDKPCVDVVATSVCKRFQKFGACVNMDKRMKQICRKTCEFCGNICKDRFKRQCRIWVYHGACSTHRKFMKGLCRESCGFCVASAPPKAPPCNNSTFGCCWDGVRTARGPNYYGCGRCEDKLMLCKLFYEDCIGGRNRAFMIKRCPKTCRLCKAPDVQVTKNNG